MSGGRGAGGTVPQALGRLRVALDDSYQRASRELGLTTQQAELLCAAMRPTPVGGLARVLRCDRSNVSRLVDRAIARGLVRRGSDEVDGRVAVIGLTDKGQRLAARFIQTLEATTGALLATWSIERQQAAAKTIIQLAEALEMASGDGGRVARARAD